MPSTINYFKEASISEAIRLGLEDVTLKSQRLVSSLAPLLPSYESLEKPHHLLDLSFLS